METPRENLDHLQKTYISKPVYNDKSQIDLLVCRVCHLKAAVYVVYQLH